MNSVLNRSVPLKFRSVPFRSVPLKSKLNVWGLLCAPWENEEVGVFRCGSHANGAHNNLSRYWPVIRGGYCLLPRTSELRPFLIQRAAPRAATQKLC